MSNDERYSLGEIEAAFLKAFSYMAENEADYSLEQLVKALRGQSLEEDDEED